MRSTSRWIWGKRLTWKRLGHFQSIGQLWKTSGAVSRIHCERCVEGTRQSVIPGRCVSGQFTRLLKRAKPPFFSATMLFLDTRFAPRSQFLYSAALSAFSVFHSLPLDLYSEACLREPSKVFLPPSNASCPLPMPYFFFFFWRIISLWCCVGFCCTLKWISHMDTYTPCLLIHTSSQPSGSLQTPEVSSLCYKAAAH